MNTSAVFSHNLNPHGFTRTCVYRSAEFGGPAVRVNVNDEVGLTDDSDYSLEEYLDDQARFDGRKLVAKANGTFLFDDGSVQRLQEGQEALSQDVLRDLPLIC